MTTLTGRCACGAVKWSTPGPVLWAGHCHCESCRRATASAFTSFIGVPRSSVTWHGTLAFRASSENVRRGHCPACGSQMLYEAARWPDETHLYAATLDDPALFQPQFHSHWIERLDWFDIHDDLPKHDTVSDEGAPV